MKITIDTKQDSRDEIRKVIRLLNDLLGSKEKEHIALQGLTQENTFATYQKQPEQQTSSLQTETPFFNMFEAESSTSESNLQTNVSESTEKKKEPEFEIYEY